MQITCNTSSAAGRVNATCCEGTAQLLRLTEFKSHLLGFILLVVPLTDEGGRKPEYPEKTPGDELHIWIYEISWLAVLHGKNFNIGHYTQTCQSIFFIPALLISTVNVYHFYTIFIGLDLAGGHKVSAKQNFLASFSPAFFN